MVVPCPYSVLLPSGCCGLVWLAEAFEVMCNSLHFDKTRGSVQCMRSFYSASSAVFSLSIIQTYFHNATAQSCS